MTISEHNKETAIRPTFSDMKRAIEMARDGDWIDPTDYADGEYWSCDVYNASGQRVGNSKGLTAGDALGLAWLCCEYPDALWQEGIPDDAVVSYVVPSDLRFELTSPTRRSAAAKRGVQ